MTPLPKPTPRLRRMRQDNPIPMTSAAYLRWLNKRPKPDLTRLSRPYWGDRVCATPAEGAGGDEVDAGYLAAVRQAPRLVGLGAGEVPLVVAGRLYDAGLVRKVVGG